MSQSSVPSAVLAANHGVFLGTIYSFFSAVCIVSLWMPGVSVLGLPIMAVATIASSRMHMVRRSLGIAYGGYSFWLATFATLLSTLFTFVLILAVGKEACIARMTEGMMADIERMSASMPKAREMLSDVRIHVGGFAMQYWGLSFLFLLPIGNLLASAILSIRRRAARTSQNN